MYIYKFTILNILRILQNPVVAVKPNSGGFNPTFSTFKTLLKSCYIKAPTGSLSAQSLHDTCSVANSYIGQVQPRQLNAEIEANTNL